MNRRVIQLVAGFVLMVGLTAAVLARARANYVLGQAGVKLVDAPMYDENTNVIAWISAYLPETIGEMRSRRVEPVTSPELAMLPPDTVYGRRVYAGPDHFSAMISIVVMGTDRTSIHKPQYCLVGQGEQIVGSEIITVPISSPHPYDLKVMKLTTRSEQRLANGQIVPLTGLFLYWFVADGHLTPRHEERMWLLARDLLTKGLLQRWAYVAYFSRCVPGQEAVLLERMKQFIAESVPEFQLTTGGPVEGKVAWVDGRAETVNN